MNQQSQADSGAVGAAQGNQGGGCQPASTPAKTSDKRYDAPDFDKWARESGVYYHLSQRDGDWTTEQALQACWKAAQAASAATLAEARAERDQEQAFRQRAIAQRDALTSRVEAAERDARRYRWLRDHAGCTISVSRNDGHAVNYMTASDWIDNNPDWFARDDPAEVQWMRETGNIWTVQDYPNTPIGFNAWNASTLDAAIDAASGQSTGETE